VQADAKHAFFWECDTWNRLLFEKLHLDLATPVQACTQERCDKPGKHCSYDYLPGADSTKVLSVASRFTSHSKNYHFDRTTSKYVCKPHSSTFSDPSDYCLHMIHHHGAPLAAVLALNCKDIIGGSLTFWYKICQVYIPRTESTENNHFLPHLLEVNAIMEPFGLTGFEFSHQWLHPAFCPFCLFKKNLPVSMRMQDHHIKGKFMLHVEAHHDSTKGQCPLCMPRCYSIRGWSTCHLRSDNSNDQSTAQRASCQRP
jgi:hypothetical protein